MPKNDSLLPFIGIDDINAYAKSIPDCIRFDRGSAQFPFPTEFVPLIDNVKEAITDKYLYHPAVGGEPELRTLIAKIEQTYAKRLLTPEYIILTDGGYAGLFTVLRFILNPGDEVITNTISYEGFATILQDSNATQVRTNLADGDSVETAITHKTKAILVNTPENPTGNIYSENQLTALAEIAKENDIWLMVDEVTNRIIYTPTTWYGLNLGYDKTVAINSFSKNWFISGISAGWIATTNEALRKRLTTSPYAESTGIDLLTQLLLIEILKNIDYEHFLNKRLTELHQRRNTMQELLTKQGITSTAPKGGMNFYVDLKEDTEQIFQKAIRKKIAFIPGRYFEGKPSMYARLGFGAVELDEIEEGISMLVGL